MAIKKISELATLDYAPGSTDDQKLSSACEQLCAQDYSHTVPGAQQGTISVTPTNNSTGTLQSSSTAKDILFEISLSDKDSQTWRSKQLKYEELAAAISYDTMSRLNCLNGIVPGLNLYALSEKQYTFIGTKSIKGNLYIKNSAGTVGITLSSDGKLTTRDRLKVNNGGADISGAVTIRGSTYITDGDNNTKFTFNTTNGNLSAVGALNIGGGANLSGTVYIKNTSNATKIILSSDGKLSTENKLTVKNGGASIVGDFEVKNGGTSIFTVDHSTGNTNIAGTTTSGGALTVNDGGASITGATSITNGNFEVKNGDTSNFTVNHSNGNTNIAGTTTSGSTLTVNAGGANINGTVNIKNGATNKIILGNNGNLTATGNLYVGTSTTNSAIGVTAEVHSGSSSYQGTVYAGAFTGTSYRALWGDLAEKYESDKKYEPGTLVKFGGNREITIADNDVNAVISTSPGYTLNDKTGEDWLPVAMVGRVPVKIKGKISKFERIMLSDEPGIACRYDCTTMRQPIGIALENSVEDSVTLVNCVVKLQI